MFTLYPEQVAQVDRLEAIAKRSRVSLNLSDTGTGKTLMFLELARRLGLRPFVLVPKAGVTQFIETARFQEVPLEGCTNIEKLKTGKYPQLRRMTSGAHKYLWQLPKGSMICWDEAHRAGGLHSENSKLMAQLKAYPELHVHLMSATLADSPLKLRAAGFLAGLHEYQERDYMRWCYAHGVAVNQFTQRLEFDRSASRVHYLHRIHELLAPFSVRLRVEDIAGFPENEITPLMVDLNARDTAEIQGLYAEMRDVVRNLDAVTAEVELLRRRQRAEFLKVGAIADLIEDGIEEGKSVAVFLCFRDSLFALEQLLKERSIAAVKIIGGQSDTHREAAIRAFQNNECFAMLTMAQCGGISLNLHDILGRSRLALLSPDWNGVVVKQCLGRIHRAGGLSKSVQRLVLCAQTVEQNVYQSVMRKMGNMKGINEGAVAEAVESGFYEAVRGG